MMDKLMRQCVADMSKQIDTLKNIVKNSKIVYEN